MAFKRQKLGPWQKAWLRSLESGEHSQTKKHLTVFDKKTKEYKHCCLGVACEVLLANNETLDIDCVTNNISTLDIYVYDDDNGLAPNKVVETLKLYDAHGPIDKEQVPDHLRHILDQLVGNAVSLVEMNDNGVSFKEIARFIRRFPQAVFSEPA